MAQGPSESSETRKGDGGLNSSLLGTVKTKAGYEGVDRNKVAQVVFNASKGSVFMEHQVKKSAALNSKIEQMLQTIESLGAATLKSNAVASDQIIKRMEDTRDLSQFIVHVDCDCFYASVEQLDHPELANTPFAVGEVVIAACNYTARQFGCRSGMLPAVAREICPELKILKLNHTKYKAKTEQMRLIMERFDPRYESCGEDEAYLNITQYCTENSMHPVAAVEKLRLQIRNEAGLAVAAGIGANIQIAKICSTKNKPDGVFQLSNKREDIMAFMNDLPCRKAIGIGPSLEQQLAGIGVLTCGEIYSQRQILRSIFGEKISEFLLQVYLGCGRSKLQPRSERPQKSVSIEKTFPETSSLEVLEGRVREICVEVAQKLGEIEKSGKVLTFKLRFKTFDTSTKQTKLTRPISKVDDLIFHSLQLLKDLIPKEDNVKVRLIGVRVTDLALQREKHDFFTRNRSACKRKFSDSSDLTEFNKSRIPPNPSADYKETQEDLIEETSLPTDAEVDGLQTRKPKEILASSESSSSRGNSINCPVCNTAQLFDNVSFNQHLDYCLSRSEIQKAATMP